MNPTFNIMVKYGTIPYQMRGDGFHGIDCVALMRRYYAEFLGIQLPDSPFHWRKLFRKLREDEEPVKDDMILMMGANRQRLIDHIGVMVTDKDMLHAAEPYGGVVCVPFADYVNFTLSIWRLRDR